MATARCDRLRHYRSRSASVCVSVFPLAQRKETIGSATESTEDTEFCSLALCSLCSLWLNLFVPSYSEGFMRRSRWPIWLAVSCCCLALLLSCALGLLSVQQQWVRLPAFAVRLGPVWLTSCFPRWEMTSSLGCVSD